MNGEIDFYLKIDKVNMCVVEMDWGRLSVKQVDKNTLKISLTEFSINDDYHNGLTYICYENKFSLRNDFFCTVPVYYIEKNDHIYISSNFELLTNISDCALDFSGIWESLLFGNCVYNRTIFSEIKQLPALHELAICNNNTFISRYDSIRYFPELNISPEVILDEIDARLVKIFSQFVSRDEKQEYVIGVSGGLDSRLTLAYLARVGVKNVKPFTFFATDNSLELSLARKVCQKFNYSEPEPFKLRPTDYERYLSLLSSNSGGQLGFHHSHILNCLEKLVSRTGNVTYSQISNYFTDAIFGWATEETKCYGVDSWTKVVQESSFLPLSIKNEIFSDIGFVFDDYSEEQNFSSKDEYKYIFERNQKFHINLAFQQHRFTETFLPYCDYELMRLVFSLPLHYRANKVLSEILLDRMNNMNISSLSSRQMIGGKGFSQKDGLGKFIESMQFRFANLLTLSLSWLTRGKLVYKNKYQSEAHYNLYHSLQHQGKIREDIKFLEEMGIFDRSSAQWYEKMSPRKGKTAYFFQLHSLVSYLRNKNINLGA